jgi:hypothetical protein
MGMTPKTIDNLGYDASQRYAVDQQFLSGQDKIHQEARELFGQTQVNTATPSFSSEVDSLLNPTGKNPAWANFSAPHGFFEHKKKFFTHQLLPQMSIQEKNEGYAKKITDFDGHQEENEHKPEWEITKEAEKTDKEKTALLNLLNCLLNLDKCMLYVNSKRTQYHKG